MADFSKLALDGVQGLLQGNIEKAFTKVRKDIDAAGNYTPSGAVGVVWASPAPTTVSEALDRIAKAVSSGTSGPIGT